MPYTRRSVRQRQQAETRPSRFSEETLNVPQVEAFLTSRRINHMTIERVVRELNQGNPSTMDEILEYYRSQGVVPPITYRAFSDEPVASFVNVSGVYCDRCGDQISDAMSITWNGKTYHPECFTIEAINRLTGTGQAWNSQVATGERCPVCQRNIYQGEDTVKLFFGSVHKSCLRAKWTKITCANCGTIGHPEVMRLGERGGSAMLCPDCYSKRMVRCSECGVVGHAHNFVEKNSRGDLLCPQCAERYVRCDECGQMFITNPILEKLCFRCHAVRFPARRLHNYGYKPKPRFHGKAPIQYGIELEVDNFPNRDMNRLGLRALHSAEKGETSFYIKTDGSLNDGYELVFHPRELASWFSYRDKLETITKAVKDAGGKSFETDTCGIHVHRGNADITPYHVVKMNFVLSRFRKMTKAVAMRSPNRYTKEFYMVDHNDGGRVLPSNVFNCHKLAKMSPRDKRYHVDRYLQLNFQNEHTIELRIFKGNLNVPTILANILFFDRLVEFTRKMTIREIDKMTEQDMAKLFDGFCKNMMTRSTMGRRKDNQFTKVGWEATNKLSSRLEIVFNAS